MILFSFKTVASTGATFWSREFGGRCRWAVKESLCGRGRGRERDCDCNGVVAVAGVGVCRSGDCGDGGVSWIEGFVVCGVGGESVSAGGGGGNGDCGVVDCRLVIVVVPGRARVAPALPELRALLRLLVRGLLRVVEIVVIWGYCLAGDLLLV